MTWSLNSFWHGLNLSKRCMQKAHGLQKYNTWIHLYKQASDQTWLRKFKSRSPRVSQPVQEDDLQNRQRRGGMIFSFHNLWLTQRENGSTSRQTVVIDHIQRTGRKSVDGLLSSILHLSEQTLKSSLTALRQFITLHQWDKMSYWQVCILQKEKKNPPNKLPMDRPRQDERSLPASTKMTPCREAMWRNNKRWESWQRSVCWLRTSEAALFAGSKHCSHVGLKTNSEFWSLHRRWKHLVSLRRSDPAERRHNVCSRSSSYRCSYRCGFSLQSLIQTAEITTFESGWWQNVLADKERAANGGRQLKPHRDQTGIPRNKQQSIKSNKEAAANKTEKVIKGQQMKQMGAIKQNQRKEIIKSQWNKNAHL